MVTLINIIHIAVCLGLIVIVLFQADKSEGLAGAFGGGASNTIFGERGSGGFMSNLTTTLAVIFMITSIYLSVFAPRTARRRTIINPVAAPMSLPQESTTTTAQPAETTAQPTTIPVETTTTAPAASTMAPTANAPIAPNEAVPAPAPAQVPVQAPAPVSEPAPAPVQAPAPTAPAAQ